MPTIVWPSAWRKLVFEHFHSQGSIALGSHSFFAFLFFSIWMTKYLLLGWLNRSIAIWKIYNERANQRKKKKQIPPTILRDPSFAYCMHRPTSQRLGHTEMGNILAILRWRFQWVSVRPMQCHAMACTYYCNFRHHSFFVLPLFFSSFNLMSCFRPKWYNIFQ